MRSFDDTGLERLAFEASLRALAAQEAKLEDLRARAGTLLAAGALITSFLGARVLDGNNLSVIAWLAIGAFVGTLLATLYVLSPQQTLVFGLDGPEISDTLSDVRDDMPEIYRRLSHWFTSFRLDNRRALDRLYIGYQLAASALVAQVVLWIVALAAILR